VRWHFVPVLDEQSVEVVVDNFLGYDSSRRTWLVCPMPPPFQFYELGLLFASYDDEWKDQWTG